MMDFETIDLTRKRKKGFSVLLPKGRIAILIGEDRDSIHITADDNYTANKKHELMPIHRFGSGPTNKAISLFIVEGAPDLEEKNQVVIQTTLESQTIEFSEIPLYSLFVRRWKEDNERVYIKISPQEAINVKTRQKETIESWTPVRGLISV